jgi:hypothetical protein
MVTNDSEQHAAMMAGVEEIVTIVTRYQQIEALYLLRQQTALKQEFERQLVSLYKHIIRYQISATCYYRRNTMRQYSCAVVNETLVVPELTIVQYGSCSIPSSTTCLR